MISLRLVFQFQVPIFFLFYLGDGLSLLSPIPEDDLNNLPVLRGVGTPFYTQKTAKRFGKIHTRNEWRRYKTTLGTSGEDIKLHSEQVEKI